MTTMDFPEITDPHLGNSPDTPPPKTPSAIATSITTVQGEVAKFDLIAAGLAAIEKAHPKNVIVAAIDTPAGMRQAEASWRAWRNPRLQVESARKAAKAPVLALGKAIDTFAADLEAQLSAGEKHYKAQITAEEERREAVKAEAARLEAERLASLRAKVDEILAGWIARCSIDGMTAARVAAGIDGLSLLPMPADQGLEDVAAHWDSCKLLTMGKMENIRLGLARKELEAERAEQARQEAARVEAQRQEQARIQAELDAQQAALRAESARVTSITRRISEIHAAATGHDKASAWELFEAITAVEALDVGEGTYQEFAPAAQAAQASTLAALRAKHTAAVAREDEQANAARDAQALVQAACAMQASQRPELKSDLQQLAQAAETAAEELAPETVDPDLVLAAEPESANAEELLPHGYLLAKLAMVMPLFQEARDALTALTEQQRIRNGISSTLADRMDIAGTFSLTDWETFAGNQERQQ